MAKDIHTKIFGPKFWNTKNTCVILNFNLHVGGICQKAAQDIIQIN